MHDARASRDGLAIRLDGTRTNLSQRFVIWGLANAWRLPALHFAEWKIGTGLSAPSMKRMHRHARQQVRDHETTLVAVAIMVRRYASAKVLVSAESALHAAATSKRKTLEE